MDGAPLPVLVVADFERTEVHKESVPTVGETSALNLDVPLHEKETT